MRGDTSTGHVGSFLEAQENSTNYSLTIEYLIGDMNEIQI